MNSIIHPLRITYRLGGTIGYKKRNGVADSPLNTVYPAVRRMPEKGAAKQLSTGLTGLFNRHSPNPLIRQAMWTRVRPFFSPSRLRLGCSIKHKRLPMHHRTTIRLFSAVIAISIHVATAAVAQDSTQQYLRPALVKTNLTGPFSLLGEVPVTHQQSLQGSAKYLTWGLFGKATFFNLTPEYRFYLSKQPASARRPAPKGFYVGPYLRYQSVVEEHIGILGSQTYGTVFYTMFGGGAMVGTQFISRGGFVFDTFLGTGYFPLMHYRITTERTTYRSPDAQPEDYRFDLRLGVCIGLAF